VNSHFKSGIFSGIFLRWWGSLILVFLAAILITGRLLSSEWNVWLLYGLPASLLITFPLAFYFTQNLIGPLREAIRMTREFSEGDFTARVRVYSGGEVAQLAAVLNETAAKLSLKFRDIEEPRARLTAILNGMIEGIMVLDARGKVLLFNEALKRMFFPGDEPGPQSFYYELIRHRELNEFIRGILLSPQNRSDEIRFSVPRERFFRVQASIPEKIATDQKGVFAVFMFHDISDIRQLERIRKDFVDNVSHELRTPLTSMAGYLEALEDLGESFPAEGKEFLSILKRQTSRMESIVSDLLSLARLESGRDPIQLQRIDLKPFLEKIVSPLLPLALKKNLKVDMSVEAGLAMMADPDKVQQVITNLFDNAVKYTPNSGQIRIEIEPQERYLALIVADNGLGIPEKDQERVFERFFRVDRARSRDVGGTGLGLSIVKHIMELHGGRISVKSEPGKGSRFTALFPANPAG